MNYIKADGLLQKAEKNAKPSCRYSDQLFKDYCKKQNLKYEPDKSGVGRCIITQKYCKTKSMLYDSNKKECKPKDKVAEALFGKTMTRGLQNLDKVNTCPIPCKKDAWCAGLNICKPITNSGQGCWSKKHQSCWCKSNCNTPMNKQAAYAAATAAGTVVAVVATYVAVTAGCAATVAASVAACVGTMGPGCVLAVAAVVACKAGYAGAAAISAMAVGAGVTATAAFSLEAGRCTAGIDGLTLPGGANGTKHFIHIHEPGCNVAYSCPNNPDNSYYCPGGMYPKCKPSKDPGKSCLTNFHSWCKGHSKCLPIVRPAAIAATMVDMGISASISYANGKCSAGKDGINQVGKRYKFVDKLKKGNENPIITKALEDLKKIAKENNQNNESNAIIERPPKFKPPQDKILIADNGDKHYMKLGVSGCGSAMSCPPNYYCPVGAGPCKPAKGPGKYCVLDSWCRGESKCLPNSKCSAGRDGINTPGPLYFLNEKHQPITEPGYIYYESTNKKVWSEKRALIYNNGSGRGYVPLNTIGCGATAPTSDGYYCKTAFNHPQKARLPGKSCYFGVNKQCRGDSKCVSTVTGEKCSAGEDGKNPPGKLTNYDLLDTGNIYRYWPEGSKKKIKLNVRLAWLHPPITISEQPNRHFIALNTTGCSIVAKCPDKVKHVNEYGENEITHTYCKDGWHSCKYARSPGRGCLSVFGSGDRECKEKRCKGGTCSTKIGNNWYVPIDGRCGNAGAGKKSDPCEPDTKCSKSGVYKIGNCVFGA